MSFWDKDLGRWSWGPFGRKVLRPPTLKEWEKMVEAMGSGDCPTRKLPPREGQPSDEC